MMNSEPTMNRFRLVRLPPELQQQFALPEIICADPNGLPFGEGQAFYAWLIAKNGCRPATAINYLKAVLPFLTFLWSRSPPTPYTTAVAPLRESIEIYLSERLGCAIRPHAAGNLLITHSKTVTRQSIRLFLSALKRFYDYLIWIGRYPEPNPLSWEKWLALRNQPSPPKMPPRSGMTLPNRPVGRIPALYFCVVGEEWKPEIIDDPSLPRKLVGEMTHLRDQIIVRMLFESGARINEILSLTISDWQQLVGRRHGALATNKGAWGERVKEIWWSSETSRLLRQYLDGPRHQHDPFNRRSKALSGAEPLFLAETGCVYSYPAFYYHWRQACRRSELKIHPHQARHWFVTMALRRIAALPDEADREAYRQGLVLYMHWKQPETIQIYDHHLRLGDFGTIHMAIGQLVQGGQDMQAARQFPPLTPETPADVPPQTWERLRDLFDEEEVL